MASAPDCSLHEVDLLAELASHLGIQRGIVFRAALLPALGPSAHFSFTENDGQLLLLVFHHISFDGWSLQLFLQELSELCSQTQCEIKKNAQVAEASTLQVRFVLGCCLVCWSSFLLF